MKGMYTSNGNYSLRNSFPEDDSGIVEEAPRERRRDPRQARPVGVRQQLRQPAVGLLEPDRPGRPRASTPTRTRAARRRAPARRARRRCRCSRSAPRPRARSSARRARRASSASGRRSGSCPAYGIGPISSSQDTAGPMDRSVANAAMHLQSMAGRDPQERGGLRGRLRPELAAVDHAGAPDPLPDYMSALDLNFVRGKRIGYNGTFDRGTPAKLAFDALVAAGAIMVPARVDRRRRRARPARRLPAAQGDQRVLQEPRPAARRSSRLAEEIADNQANAHEALKFGNDSHVNAPAADVSPGRAERDGLPRRHADPARGAVEGHRRHDEQRDARRSERRLHRDPRQRPERRDRGHAADHDPDGLQRDARGAR